MANTEQNYKGYALSSRNGCYTDPKGNCFTMGWKQSNNTVIVHYISEKKEMEIFGKDGPTVIPLDVADALVGFEIVIREKKEEEEKQRAKIEAMENMYRPGGIGYLFLKQKTQVGKKQ